LDQGEEKEVEPKEEGFENFYSHMKNDASSDDSNDTVKLKQDLDDAKMSTFALNSSLQKYIHDWEMIKEKIGNEMIEDLKYNPENENITGCRRGYETFNKL